MTDFCARRRDVSNPGGGARLANSGFGLPGGAVQRGRESAN
jgi:hypothetical protein